MIDAGTYARLQVLIRRESRTLLQYAVESFPWTRVSDAEAVRTLQTLAREEAEAAAALARFLASQHLTPPGLGSFPSTFTRFNFLGLDRWLPLLVKEQRQGVAALEADLRQIKEPATREKVEAFLALKQRHLLALEGLANPPETKSVA